MLHDSTALAVSSAALPALGERIRVPTYDRAVLRRSIVHFGVGGFHRAHLATYVDEIAETGNTDWSIVGVGVMAADRRIHDVLRAQDHLYTLIARGADATSIRVVGSIVDHVLAVDDASAAVDLIADPDTQIVSMTITEGGYPVDDRTHAFVASQSLENGVFATLARGLDQRRRTGGGGLTVMSCDNVMTNGSVARIATLGEAARRSPDLARWIEEHVRFPNSMVDRITPATTPADRQWLLDQQDIVDEWPVVAEPFRQWVIEDDFGGDPLPLDTLDVIVTDDIDPYELTKLRLLNAGHSCLAYLAALAGYERVDEAMSDPVLREFVRQLLDREAKPTLPAAAGIDLDEYIASLIDRFSNPGVGDQVSRLCLDGSVKFPKFLLPTIDAQLDRDGEVERSALALAAWCEYLATFDSPASDPHLDRATEHAHASIDDPHAFLRFEEVFGADLPSSTRFADAFATALLALRRDGVQSVVRARS